MIELRRIRSLRGPNIWADFQVAEAWLDLSEVPAGELPDLCNRLRNRSYQPLSARKLPRRAALNDLLGLQKWLAGVVECLAADLRAAVGHRVAFRQTRATTEPGVLQIAFDLGDETATRRCLETAVELCESVRCGRPFDLTRELAALTAEVEASRSDCGTAKMLTAAKSRGIPVSVLNDQLIQFGYGARQKRTQGIRTQLTGAVAEWSLSHSNLVATLLASAGVPTRSDIPVNTPHYRLLVVGRTVAAAIRWDPPYFGNGHGGRPARASDVSTQLHPEVAARAVDAARALSLDIAEVRIVAADIGQPLESQEGAVSEVHSNPPLDWYEQAQVADRVADSILGALYPSGHNGRIPIVAVTGTNGKTTTTRLVAHALSISGRFVGMTCTDGIYLAGRRVDVDDCAGPKSARLVLMNPEVEAAVLETARGGILREGLGFDACDIAVVTNIGEGDHLGISGVDTVNQLAEVKQTVVRAVTRDGVAVLNAADPLVVPMAARCPGTVTFFSCDEQNPVLSKHRAQLGRVAFVRDGLVVLAQGAEEHILVSLERVPLTLGGRIGFQVENVLAGAAAMWGLGLPWETIRLALTSFGTDIDKSPGRFNVLDVNGATVIFDYGHNPSSLLAMIDALEHFPQKRRLAVYSSAGDRRDVDMIRQGEILGAAFDLVVLYEDQYVRGRLPGEIMSLIRQGMAEAPRARDIRSIQGWRKAAEEALSAAQPGDLVLIQADSIDETMDYVQTHLLAIGEPAHLGEAPPPPCVIGTQDLPAAV